MDAVPPFIYCDAALTLMAWQSLETSSILVGERGNGWQRVIFERFLLFVLDFRTFKNIAHSVFSLSEPKPHHRSFLINCVLSPWKAVSSGNGVFDNQ